jgi:hypothetical protein
MMKSSYNPATVGRWQLVGPGLWRILSIILLALLTMLLPQPYSASATVCNDGSISESTGSGTCSWHGGVRDGSPSSGLGGGGGVGRITPGPGYAPSSGNSVDGPLPFAFAWLFALIGAVVGHEESGPGGAFGYGLMSLFGSSFLITIFNSLF